MGARAAGRSRFLPWTFNNSAHPQDAWGSLWTTSIQSSPEAQVSLTDPKQKCWVIALPSWIRNKPDTEVSRAWWSPEKSSENNYSVLPWIPSQDKLEHLSEVLLSLDKISKDHIVPLALPKYVHMTTPVQSMVQDQRMPQGKDHRNQLLLTLSLCKMVPSILWQQTKVRQWDNPQSIYIYFEHAVLEQVSSEETRLQMDTVLE